MGQKRYDMAMNASVYPPFPVRKHKLPIYQEDNMRHETKRDAAARMARYNALDAYLDHWDRQKARRRLVALRVALGLICAAWLLSFAVLAL